MEKLSADIDLQLLKLLQKDGRKSFSEISRELEIPLNVILQHYLDLIESGTLTIIGRIDSSKFGITAYASVLISINPKSKIYEAKKILEKIKEVSFLALVNGQCDIEVNIMCRDKEHLEAVVRDKIQTVEGVTSVAVSVYKEISKFSQPDLESLMSSKG
ncbi:MAG: Lrp/AsnC family transcriptional regulator [Chitinophagaceae bacterium]|nr:MAG: Lrp/AsnC family transcriptional regulator [Chitinophagaceae bacterium]